MAIEVVEERLGSLRNLDDRSKVALHLAETCYECFSVEELFRTLIDTRSTDLDGILTALVNLEISFDHIRDHLNWLKRPLDSSIRQVDLALQRATRGGRKSATARR